MQSGSYEVTARPASTTGCCTGRQTTDQQPGHPNRGVSRKQESGRLPAPDTLTVEGIADRPDRAAMPASAQAFTELHRGVLAGLNRSLQHRLVGSDSSCSFEGFGWGPPAEGLAGPGVEGGATASSSSADHARLGRCPWGSTGAAARWCSRSCRAARGCAGRRSTPGAPVSMRSWACWAISMPWSQVSDARSCSGSVVIWVAIASRTASAPCPASAGPFLHRRRLAVARPSGAGAAAS